jgi:O-antigen/teichoic acid export membrane protein
LISYAASQYLSGAVGSVVTMLPPVLVAMQLGTQQAAYFYFPWLFCSASISLLWNIVFPLVVEAVHDADRTPQLLARAVWLGGLVTLGGSLVLGVGAPWILAIVGGEYERGGTMALRLIALSLPFTGVNTLYIALSLILKRTWAVTRLQGIASALFVVGSFPAMHRWGITGMALAFMASRAFLAVCAIPGIISQFRELVSNAATVVLQLGDLRFDPMYAETQVIYLPKSPPATAADHLTGGSTIYLSSAYGGALLTATGGFAPVPARSSDSGSSLEMVV